MPLLFWLFINDTFELPIKDSLVLFADDAFLHYSGFNIYDMYSNMQHDLNILSEWFFENVLSINTTKTKYIIFHADNKNVDASGLSLQINNIPIERMDTIKYLGLHLQSNLKWNTHINSITKKIAPLTGTLYKLNKCKPNHLLRPIYFAYIHSKWSYLIPIWRSASPEYAINELQIIQNKAICNIF